MLKRFAKISLPLILVFTLLISCSNGTSNINTKTASKTKNIILMIGDGMGVSQMTLGRALKATMNKQFHMDTLPVFGLVSNVPNDPKSPWITDSSAAATAIATGTSTNNHAVGVDAEGKKLTTILEIAKSKGLKTGLVATSRLSHATPASFAAHNSEREAEVDIAKQMLSQNVDVMLGGGKKMFTDAGLMDVAPNQGYSVVESKENLDKLVSENKNKKVLGLFAESHLPYIIDKPATTTPTLENMTSSALKLLDNKDGFFLMVEGSRIDMACHSKDFGAAAWEVSAFDDAVKVALDFAASRDDTLVIVTADHETGGLSIGSENDNSEYYSFVPELLSKRNFSLEEGLPSQTFTTKNVKNFLSSNFGLVDLTDDEIDIVINNNTPLTIMNNYFLIHAGIGRTSKDHTGVNVPIMAYGAGQDQFSGFMKNTDIFTKMKSVYGF